MAALRERGAQRFDPVRFRFIEALARRAAAHGGEVRRILDVRLAAALVEYGGRFDAARPEAGAGFGGSHQPAAMPDAKHSPGPLADLVLHIARHSPPNARVGQADDGAARAGPPASAAWPGPMTNSCSGSPQLVSPAGRRVQAAG